MQLGSPRDLIRRAAESHPDRLAVIAHDRELTYSQLAAEIAALSSRLRQLGVDSGVQVAQVLPNSVEFLIGYFAVLQAGGIAVPIPPATTTAELEVLLESSRTQLLITEAGSFPSIEEKGESLGMGIPRLLLLRIGSGKELFRIPHEDAGDIVVRQFSSGSTGQPKHMLKSAQNIAHDYWHFCATIGLQEGERFLGVAPFFHAYGALSFLSAFYLAGCVIILPRFFPGAVLEASVRHRPTVFLTTPPMLEVLGSCRLEQEEAEAFDALQACVCSTGRLQKGQHDAFFHRFGVPVNVMYGSTESLSATIDLDEGFEEGRVGRPFREVTVAVFDQAGGRCAPGETGRVGISSPAVCAGYVDDPDGSEQVFREGYLFPGDSGYLDSQGRLYLLGRSDIINIGGYKVDPLEVEMVIREALPVTEVFVLAGERSGLPVLRAVLEADPKQVTRSQVVSACRKRLSPHKIPVLVEIRERLERDANGKVLNSVLGD
jgi:long-chain acyl-CoA synthetase